MIAAMLARLRSHRRCVGVDLGATSIKVVRVDLERGRPSHALACVRPTPRGAFESYRISDPSALGEVLRDALGEIRARDMPIAIALPAPAVMIKRLQLGRGELRRVAERVRTEIETVMPEHRDELAFDFQIVGDTPSAGAVEVLVAGARRELIESYKKAAAEARARLAVLDLDYFALQNAIEWHPQPPTGGGVLLLHGGFRYTVLNVVVGGRSLFTTAIELGARSLASGELGQSGEGGMAEFIAGFCDDVHHTLNFYCSFVRERPLEATILSGGLAHVPGLAEALSARLGNTVRILSPLPKEIVATAELVRQPELAVAAGLATRAVGDQ
ncbi:MAG TPA: pilus assembly protein PilM [Terriglobales bacterium]|nr:pilus assembly protein PilM [Terriglobales bacterium]